MKRLLLIAMLLMALPLMAADVKLAWDPPAAGPVPAGYKVYYGTASGVYGSPIDAGNVTQYTVSNLSAGTYYFVVSAYLPGQESGYSNEVNKGIIGNPGNLRIIATIIVDEQGNIKMRYLTPEEYAAFFRAG